MGTTPVITAMLKSYYVMVNQFPRAGREPTTYGSEVARSTNSATASHILAVVRRLLFHFDVQEKVQLVYEVQQLPSYCAPERMLLVC